jgi:hypothetical protein
MVLQSLVNASNIYLCTIIIICPCCIIMYVLDNYMCTHIYVLEIYVLCVGCIVCDSFVPNIITNI